MTRDKALDTCSDAVFGAVVDQLYHDAGPTLIDAIPTVGKTTAAAHLVPRLKNLGKRITYLTHRIDNRQQYEQQVREATEGDLSVQQLPAFFRDCPTAKGEHGDDEKRRVERLYDRGVSPGTLHTLPEVSLPCGDYDCPYFEKWRGHESADVLIGHPSHAHRSRVLKDRIVIVDEDPGDAFRTDFDVGEFQRHVASFFESHDDLPVDALRGLWRLVDMPSAADQRERVLEAVREPDRTESEGRVVGEDRRDDHVAIEIAIWGLLAGVGDEEAAGGDYPRREELDNGVISTRLSTTTSVVYDGKSGVCAVRDAPDFSSAAAVVGLDGTPLAKSWAGRLGIPSEELETTRVLCDSCREEYLEDAMGYTLVRTTPYVKPYSGADAERINFQKDRGLLHTVSSRAETSVGLITTKNAKEPLLEHEDGNEIEIDNGNVAHYGAIKGSNEFEGAEIQTGVVIGSPHPGSTELRVVAGLDGVAYQSTSKRVHSGHPHRRTVPDENSEPYLRNTREDRVAQAVLRFGRTEGATVFIHTDCLPEWMDSFALEGTIEVRPDGQRDVLETVREIGPAPTAEITQGVSVGQSMAWQHLDELESEGVVCNIGNSHKARWRLSDVDVSPTAAVDLADVTI